MVDYLLDTTVIIDYLRGRRETVAVIRRLFSEGSSLGCCPINIIEVYAGMKEQETEIIEEFLDGLEHYELTKEVSRSAGEAKNAYRRKGITLSVPDVAIAAIAIANGLVLLADNPRHYPMPELKVQTPNTVSHQP
jgi:predicted nucleic acid-binding protein